MCEYGDMKRDLEILIHFDSLNEMQCRGYSIYRPLRGNLSYVLPEYTRIPHTHHVRYTCVHREDGPVLGLTSRVTVD